MWHMATFVWHQSWWYGHKPPTVWVWITYYVKKDLLDTWPFVCGTTRADDINTNHRRSESEWRIILTRTCLTLGLICVVPELMIWTQSTHAVRVNTVYQQGRIWYMATFVVAPKLMIWTQTTHSVSVNNILCQQGPIWYMATFVVAPKLMIWTHTTHSVSVNDTLY